MCTGSGVQGITAALAAMAHGDAHIDLTLVDINPRARAFVTVNLLLNGVSGQFLLSDTYDAVGPGLLGLGLLTSFYQTLLSL